MSRMSTHPISGETRCALATADPPQWPRGSLLLGSTAPVTVSGMSCAWRPRAGSAPSGIATAPTSRAQSDTRKSPAPRAEGLSRQGDRQVGLFPRDKPVRRFSSGRLLQLRAFGLVDCRERAGIGGVGAVLALAVLGVRHWRLRARPFDPGGVPDRPEIRDGDDELGTTSRRARRGSHGRADRHASGRFGLVGDAPSPPRPQSISARKSANC